MKAFEPPEWDLSKEYQKTMKLEAKRFGLKEIENLKAELNKWMNAALLAEQARLESIEKERSRCLKAVDDEPDWSENTPEHYGVLEKMLISDIIKNTKQSIRKRIEEGLR